MKITSGQFDHEGLIPQKYTCNGDNINPPLSLEDVPVEAKSLVLIMDDPDVPVSLREDGMFDHWVLFNLDPATKSLSENDSAGAVIGKTTGGRLTYQGPCPPDTVHRYFFKLYALDAILDLSEGVSKKDVEEAMMDHVLRKAELIGLYEQPDELKSM